MKTFFYIATLTIVGFHIGYSNYESSRSHLATLSPQNDSLFKANDRDDWESLQTYVVKSNDTVTIELLMVRATTDRSNWKEPTLIGRLGEDYWPTVRIDTVLEHPNRTWKVFITEKGRCYIKLKKGERPRRRDGIYVPLKIKYKK